MVRLYRGEGGETSGGGPAENRGRWFIDNPQSALQYAYPRAYDSMTGAPNFPPPRDTPLPRFDRNRTLYYVDVPAEVARASQFESLPHGHGREFVLPQEHAERRLPLFRGMAAGVPGWAGLAPSVVDAHMDPNNPMSAAHALNWLQDQPWFPGHQEPSPTPFSPSGTPQVWDAPDVGGGQDVGAGADDDNPVGSFFQSVGQRFFEDEDARRRRQALEDAATAQRYRDQGMASSQATQRAAMDRQFTPDPMTWIQERAEDVRHNPVIGSLRSLGAIPEALGTAGKYATGVALAPVQAGAQAYGWDPGAQIERIASDTQNLPGADLPFLGGAIRGVGTAAGINGSLYNAWGRTASDLATGNVPAQRGDLAGQVPWDMTQTPVPSWENPFDPREALQRSRALAGPGELAPELAAGNVAFGPMAAGLRALGGRSAGSLAPDLTNLGSVHANPFTDFFAPGTGRLGAVVPPAVGAVAGAVNPLAPGLEPGQDPDIAQRLMGAGEGFLLGGLLGMAASPLERRMIKLATPDWQAAASPAAIASTRAMAGGDEFVDKVYPAMTEAIGASMGLTGEAVTPGGAAQKLWTGLSAKFFDALAPLETASDAVDQILQATGKGNVTPGQNPFAQAALSRQHRKMADAIVNSVVRDVNEQKAALAPSEVPFFNMYGLNKAMQTAGGETKFSGPYLELFKMLKPSTGEAIAKSFAQDELVAHEGMLRNVVEQTFPDRGDIWRRFDVNYKALANGNNAALERLAETGVLSHDTVDELRTNYGDQYGYLQQAHDVYHDVLAKQSPGSNYMAAQRGAGYFHNAEEIPSYTFAAQVQHMRDAVALSEHNKAGTALADLVTRTGELPGFLEFNKMEPKPVPGQAGHYRIMRDPTGAPIIDPVTGKPKPIFEPDIGTSPSDSTAYAMQYRDNVDRDMGIIPYWKPEPVTDELGKPVLNQLTGAPMERGTYKELLVEKSIADALNGATVERANAFTGILAAQAQIFRLGVTSMAPFFWAMHGTRQFQEFIEKTPRGEMTQAMGAYLHGIYGVVTSGLADYAEMNPHSPLVNNLGADMARSIDRVMARQGWNRQMTDLFHDTGGGSSTLPTFFGRNKDAEEMFGMREPGPRGFLPRGAKDLVMRPIHTYEDAVQALTGAFDEIPRIASFDVALTKGMSTTEARRQAQTLTNDYSRMGSVTALLNQFMPLLNARKEGIFTSVSGALEDPQRFATRMTSWVGMPTIASYAANRLFYGDAYDDIPVEEKDMYWHIPYGWWSDAYGRNHPFTMKVVKSPFLQAITAPLETLLDKQYHLAANGEYLADNQRTARPDQRMWLTQLIRMSPIEGQPDAFADVKHFAMSAASLQPLASMAVELAANEDHFTGREIVPAERRMLPPQYQYNAGTSDLAKLVGKAVPLSPAYMDQIAQDMFGTAGRAAMHSADLVTNILQNHGLLAQGDPFAPTSAMDLPSLAGLPPEVVNRYLDQFQTEDTRPWQAGFLPRFFGTAYSGRAIAERAKQLGPEEHEKWQNSLEYDRHRREITATYSQKHADLENQAPDITNAAYRDKSWQLVMQEKGAREQLAHDYAGRAWTSPSERQAAINAMPGVSTEGFQKSLAQLPPGTNIGALAQQWEALGQQGNPPTVAHARNAWLAQQSNALHVSPTTILDYMGSYHLGNELVGLPVPTEDIERFRVEHAAPMDPKDPTKQLDPFTTPPDKFRQAQRDTVTRYSQLWGVPEQNLLERLNARYHLPGTTVGPTQAAQQDAAATETRFHNPAEFPRYADAKGNAVGTSNEWDIWDKQIDDARNKYGDTQSRWPGSIRILEDARRYGSANRYMDMYRHATEGTDEERKAGLTHLMNWERFYGTGRNATLSQWNDFTANGQTKYKADISPQTAMAWDAMTQLYRLLPNGPEKYRYQGYVERIRPLINPRWLRIIDARNEIDQQLSGS